MFGKIIYGLFFMIFIVLLFLVWILFYQTYLSENIPFQTLNKQGLPIISNISGQEDYPQGMMFYENLRFKQKTISYSIDDSCSEKRANDAITAFDILDNSSVLDFIEKEDGEIFVSCSTDMPQVDEKHFVVGEGGPTSIINATNFNVIADATILLYEDSKCQNPIVAIHEILHALGFKHSSNENSIMYPVSNCKQQIPPEIFERMDILYHYPTLPDLAITRIDAVKKGFLLDFTVTVMNTGLDDAPNATLLVYSGNKGIFTYDLRSLEIGVGKVITARNIRLLGGNESVTFAVDRDNLISEISEKNNIEALILKE